jgi:ferritin heavy chain
VALPNISKFFKEQSDEEREQAQKFMKYQVERFYFKIIEKTQNPQTEYSWGSSCATKCGKAGQRRMGKAIGSSS